MRRVLLRTSALFAIPYAASAFPSYVRLGYEHCAVCHISPQGGGLLNEYGRGVDEAESLRGGEYKPSAIWGSRIAQDVLGSVQERVSTSTGQPIVGKVRARALYRNDTEIGRGLRFSATVGFENLSSPRQKLVYQTQIVPKTYYVTSALISYRPMSRLEIEAGRDQIPTGINIPDLTSLLRSRNGVGFYDAPAQVKLFWWGKRYEITPYAFGRGGPEPPGTAESGGGMRAEFDVLGKGTTLFGINGLRGSAPNVNRTLIGPFMRLGHKSWGILAEHDLTNRDLVVPFRASFQQNATYAQVFWFPRGWLWFAVTGERLTVDAPFHERQMAGRGEVTARFSGSASLQLISGVQRNQLTGTLSPMVLLLLMVKPVF
jgi:hypothetical protein